jgi:hypothetical protein
MPTLLSLCRKWNQFTGTTMPQRITINLWFKSEAEDAQ